MQSFCTTSHHPTTISPLLKISNFLQMKSISIQQFWLTPRNYASPQDIISFCSSIGLKISIHDQINMKSEIFNDKEIISIYDFCQYIPYWKINGRQMVSDFLKKRSEMLIEQLQAKEKKRPKSSNIMRGKNNNNMGSKFNNTASSSNYQLHKNNSLSKIRRQSPSNNNNFISTYHNNNNSSSSNNGYNQHIASFTQNNSRKYLQKFKQREQILQKQLAQTIDKTKNQYQYSMLLKMSQMNQTNRQNNNSQTYRAYKSAEGIIRVRIFQLNKFIKEINLKQFDRIYKSFKKNNKQKKQWNVIDNQNTINNTKEINKNVHSLKMKNARKTDRQQQLKNLLVNTVNLTNLLKEQIKIFKKKGIYGCEDL